MVKTFFNSINFSHEKNNLLDENQSKQIISPVPPKLFGINKHALGASESTTGLSTGISGTRPSARTHGPSSSSIIQTSKLVGSARRQDFADTT